MYILVANRSYRYASGRRSRIIYIGTTGKGGRRPATSAIDKASQAFSELRGVKTTEVHIATCHGRKRMRTWEHLKSALLATFEQLHFGLPTYNKKKGAERYAQDIKLFKRTALENLILHFAP